MSRSAKSVFMAVASMVFSGCCELAPSFCDPGQVTSRQDARITELLGSVPSSSTQPSSATDARCPPNYCEASAGRIDSLCAEVLPGSGQLWFKGPDAQPCWCGCSRLLEFDQVVRDSLAVKRRERDAILVEQRVRTLKHLPPRASKQVVKSDTASSQSAPAPPPHIQARTVLMCDRADRKLPFNGACVSIASIRSLLFAEYPVFVTHYSDETDNPWWPTCWDYADARTHEPGEPTLAMSERMHINLPPPFYKQGQVKGELLALLMAHEIGHGLSGGFQCNPGSDVRIVCEGEADYWAVNVGLRAVYDGPEYVRVVEAALEQLQAYDDWLYDEDNECGLLFECCGDPGCGYPGISCRLDILSAALKPSAEHHSCLRTWDNSDPCGYNGCE